MGFQTSVNANPAPGVSGDFYGANPWFSTMAGAGELTAGAVGLAIGKFGFSRNDNGKTTNAHPGVPARTGFVGRQGNLAIITPFLGENTNTIPAGLECTTYTSGPFLCLFAAGAAIGQKVFAEYGTGNAVAGAAGATIAGANVTASIAATTMTVTAAATPGLLPGQPLTGANVTPGSYIVAQLTGTPGGIGTYTVSPSQTAASAAVTSASAFETNFWVNLAAGANELAVISGQKG